MDSLISEHEDNPSVEENELLSSILSAPNVQVGSISAADNSYFSSSSSLQGVLTWFVSFLSVFCTQWQGIDIFGGTYTRGEMLKLPFGLKSWTLLDFFESKRLAKRYRGEEGGAEQSRAERGCVISFWALCNGWVGVSISSRLRKVPAVVTPSWRVRKNVLQWG